MTGVLLLLIGCVTEAPPAPSPGCADCHGTAPSGAPPSALGGATDRTDRGVGAHEAHLLGDWLDHPIPCTECHLVPTVVDSPGHVDTPWPAEVVFGPLAATDRTVPMWDPEASTCTTYCHGATLTGGAASTPSWTEPEPALQSCRGCHGFPPPAPHPDDTACGDCHESNAGGVLNAELHLDGLVQTDVPACDACHGSDGDPAPPNALDGATAPTDPGVGAHRAHLEPSGPFAPTACSDCHVVPAGLTDPTHLSGQTEVVFSTLADPAGTASYDPATQTCTTWCHGSDLAGGTTTEPVWTEPQGGACNRCHGFSPPAPHPASLDCITCHPSDGAALDATHLDGEVQVTAPCDACHGHGPLGAPPPALNGATNTADPGVGQHAAHLGSSSLTATPVPCSTCHAVPADVVEPGHLNGSTEVVFSALAVANGFTASYDSATQTCTVYCHGSDAVGGQASSPAWTDSQGGACNRCHGFAPPAPHPDDLACANCHPSGPGALQPSHLDGVLDR